MEDAHQRGDDPEPLILLHLQWAEVTGNVSVEGALSATGSVFNRNVAVSGPGSELSLFNYASHIKGNLSVT
jgi:hypothetical protein